MDRFLMNDLKAWKAGSSRKPLLLQGARQVGKTFLLEQFGKEQFRKLHYVNLEEPEHIKFFEKGPYDTEEIILRIEFELDVGINRANDIIFFDEIQESPKAIHSLKYFCEKHPELAICCAGSHIGVEGARSAFPVGKVNFLTLYPMSLDEFIQAYSPRLHKMLHRCISELEFPDMVHQKLLEVKKLYTLVGGLPEAVKDFINTDGDTYVRLLAARSRHRELVKGYEMDFAKYSSVVNAHRVSSVFHNIPVQIEAVHDGSIGRFKFKGVISGQSKFTHLNGPIDWLIHSGLARKIWVISRNEAPLKAFTKENMFKLVGFDVGIFCTQLDMPFKMVMNQSMGFFKGFIAEVFVSQELAVNTVCDELISWKNGEREIEFLLSHEGAIVPLEVKSGTRLRAKSFNSFKKEYLPDLAIKLSGKNMRFEKKAKQLNAPLYLAGYLNALIPRCLD